MDALLAMHRKIGECYPTYGESVPFPDISNPLWVSKLILEREGKAQMAILAHMTAEAYFLVGENPQAGDFRKLHDAATSVGYYINGFEDVNVWLPPEIEKSFGYVLRRMGWQKQLWASYSRKLEG